MAITTWEQRPLDPPAHLMESRRMDRVCFRLFSFLARIRGLPCSSPDERGMIEWTAYVRSSNAHHISRNWLVR